MSDFVQQAGIAERRPARGLPLLHAVSVEAQLSGLSKPDAECGQLVDELTGPWHEVEGRFCPRCLRVLASLSEEVLAA